MKIYQIIHRVWNRKGRIIVNDSHYIGFNTESEMNYYMNGLWSMSDDNESYVAYESR